MQDKYVQAIRYKLQKRIRALNSAGARVFPLLMNRFLSWFNSVPILASVRDELQKRAPATVLSRDLLNVLSGGGWVADSEIEAAALGYALIEKLAAEPDFELFRIVHPYGSTKTNDDTNNLFREIFVEPFYEYVDEHIDDQQAILYFLRRYKHRCEWFQADRLRERLEADTQRGEKGLAFDLYEYLHDQGIDLHIEPKSASGIADLVAEQVGDERVIADAKLYWPEKGKGKSYLLSAFHQAYTYARDFNEAFAYLVVYKLCKEDIAFMVPNGDSLFPCLTVNNKTIFFIVIDICDHGASASKRGQLTAHEITAQELIQAVG